MKLLNITFLIFTIFTKAQQSTPNTVVKLKEHLNTIKEIEDKIQYLKQVSTFSEIDSIKITAYYQLARNYYIENKEIDSSLKYINQIQTKYSPKTYPKLFCNTLIYKGKSYDFKNEPEIALKHYESALVIAEENRFYKSKAHIYNSMADVYIEQSDTLKAFEFYKAAIQNAFLSKKNPKAYYNNIGVLFFPKNKDSAIFYFNKALDINIKNNDINGKRISYTNLAHAYLRKNNPEDYPTALDYLGKAEQIAIENNSSLYYINFYYGLYYEKINNFSLAEKYYRITLNDITGLKEAVQHIKVLYQVAQFYEKNGRFDEALIINKQYHHLKDSIYSVEKNTAFNNIRTKYEVEKKDQNIALLQKENDLAATKRKWIITTAAFICIGLIGLFLFYRHRARNQQLLRAQEQALFTTEKESLQKTKELAEIKALVSGRDKERHRVATELHDGVGGKLSGVHIALSTLNNDLKNNHLQQISGFIKESLEEIRALSHGLSSSYIKDRSLESLIVDLKNDIENRHDISVELSFFPIDVVKSLDKELKHHLYRITQELCSNTLKHAKATHISISINKHNHQISFIYEDNGCGFDSSMTQKGIGLKNIKERTDLLNATLLLDSFPGRGTHVTLEIPLL